MAKVADTPNSDAKMKSWEINSFGEPTAVLKLNNETPIPKIKKPNQVLVKVKACSVNPIDVYMVRGYGSKVIQIVREKDKGRNIASILFNRGKEFPICNGRDFAGIVTEIGSAVTQFKVGDEVYGVVYVTESGSNGEYVLVLQDWIQLKPEFLSFTDAASIPYVALTTWSALRNAGGYRDFTNKNFLILGGSGGVGVFSIQYLKSRGAKVTTTGSSNSLALMTELGADFVVDYKDPEMGKLLESHGPYDCIYDLAGDKDRKMLQYGQRGGKYITLTNPAVHNVDNYGMVLGGIKAGTDLLGANMTSCFRHRMSFKWGFFTPDGVGWKEIADLVKEHKIKPIVEQVYKYEHLPEAYDRVDKGHLRGKIMVEVNADSEEQKQ